MPNLQACVLAAGKGTRMGGDRPKVLFQAGGKCLIEWVLGALSDAGVDDCVAVVGFRKEEVIATLPTGVRWVEQSPQLGTGHAVRCARHAFTGDSPDILVACGDMPLVSGASYRRLVELRRSADAAVAVLTVGISPDSRFGRVVRNADGSVARIAEYGDASDEERGILEGNAGVYCFRPASLWEILDRVGNDNRQGEYYLPDVVPLFLAGGEGVVSLMAENADEALGVNTPEDLARVERALGERRRIQKL